MSNTKKWKESSSSMRKGIKRSERKALKVEFAAMSPALKAKFRKSEEKHGLRQFIAAQKKKD
jgi:hypothetical protein